MRTRIPWQGLAFLIAALLLINALVYGALLRSEETPTLSVSFLDVGQGDAILIEGPTGIEMLIDGGKDRSVVRALPEVMGPFDRSIDIVLATHPDADHIGGLPEVLGRYRVSTIFVSGRGADTPQSARFADAIEKESGATGIVAKKGMRIHLGGHAYADVLYPEGDVTRLKETNDASIMVRVVFGESEFLFTGDAPEWAEERVVAAYGETLQSDVLKAGHHGSRTSTGEKLLIAANPSVVVISAGKDNSYGHPHPEVLERISASGASYVSTIESGTITFKSDGKTLWRK